MIFTWPSVRPYVRRSVPPHHGVTNMRWHALEITLCCVFDPCSSRGNKSQKQFINGKKKFKRRLSCPFWWKAKSSSYEFAFEESVLLRTRSAQRLSSHLFCVPDAKPSSASAFWFFLSTTIFFFAAVGTHFPRKNTRVYRSTVTCVTRVTSNRVKVHRLNSQHLPMVRT